MYRQTSFHCALLYCPSKILCFSQIEDLGQPSVEQAYWHHFSNSILRPVCVTFGNSGNISSIFIIIIFAMVNCDLVSTMLLL